MAILASRELGEGITATLQEAIGGNYVVVLTSQEGDKKNLLSAQGFGKDFEAAKADFEAWRAQ